MLKERGIIQPVPNGEVNFYHNEFFHLFVFISSWCVLLLPTILILAWLFIVRPTCIFINTFILCGSRSYPYYMASSVSVQDESNPALWLATRAGKVELSCLLGTTQHVPQEKFPQKPYKKSFIDQACSVKMAGCWPHSFFASLLTLTPSRSINMQKNITWPISHTYWKFQGRKGGSQKPRLFKFV